MHHAPVMLIAMKPDLEKYTARLERPELYEAQKEDVIFALRQGGWPRQADRAR